MTDRAEAATHDKPDEAVTEWVTSVEECVTCPECGFMFATDHEDEDGGYTCPACAEDQLSDAAARLIDELSQFAADQRHAREGVARGSSVEQRYRGRAQGFEQAISTARYLFYGEETPVLRALIETYLREVGFTTYELDGATYWGHEQLGQGRRFEDALTWWMGCETVDNGSQKRQPDPSGSGGVSERGDES